MRNIYLLTAGFLLAGAIAVSAQSPRKLDYGFNFPGDGRVVAMDGAGSTYVAGNFSGTETFGSFTLNSGGQQDVFVLVIDPAGAITGATSFGGDNDEIVNTIDVDEEGQVYLGGYFSGHVDFDPGSGNFPAEPFGDRDGYLLKLNAELGFEFLVTIAGAGFDEVTGVAVNDSDNDNIYFTGTFDTDADINYMSGGSVGILSDNVSAFFAKVNHNGVRAWEKVLGNDNTMYGTAVATDFSGAPVFTGYYYGDANLNPDAAGSEVSSGGLRDVFLLKLNPSNGAFTWAKSIGGDGDDDYTRSVATDGQNNIYVAGRLYGSGDFDPGTGETILTSNGSSDIFVTKFSSAGNLVWARSFGGVDDDNGADVFATTTDVYVTGHFLDEILFDNTDFTLSDGAGAYIINLDNTGDTKWAALLGNDSADDFGYEIAGNATNVAVLGQLYATSSDMDPTCQTLNLDGETSPTWLINIGPDPADCIVITKQPVSVDVCGGAVVTLTVEATGAGINYQWLYDSGEGYYEVEDAAGFYSGAKTATLTITTGDDYQGEYSYLVLLTRGAEEVYSDPAYVDVGPTIPYVQDVINCGPGAVQLTAVGPANGEYRWYTTETGGSPIPGETSGLYTTPSLTVTTSYWVSSNDGTCESQRKKITAYITACEPPPGFHSVQIFGGAGQDGAADIIRLKDGNILIAGAFIKWVDIDPGPGEHKLTANDTFQDAYLMKMTLTGEIIWVKQFTGDNSTPSPSFVIEDPNGDIYLAGTITGGNTDFDAGAGTLNIAGQFTANNFPDGYIVKFDKDGNTLWGHKMGNNRYFDGITGLQADATSVYLTGYFWDTFSLNGSSITTNGGVNHGTDIFIAKMSSSGSVTWLKQIGNAYADGNLQTETSSGLLLKGNDLYVTARVAFLPTDVDPGASVHEIPLEGDANGYVLKLNTDGEFQSVFKHQATDGSTSIADILVDSNNIYISGSFVRTVDFDPGAGKFEITSSGGLTNSPASNAYIGKYLLDGTLVWVKTLRVPNLNGSYGGDLTVASNGDIIMSGMYQGSVDFDPGPLDYILHGSSLFLNSYVLKLNSNGEFNWAISLERVSNVSSSASGGSHFIDDEGNIYMTGDIRGSVDFDPLDCVSEYFSHPNEPLTAPATYSNDYYIWKLSFNSANICFDIMPAGKDVCAGGLISFDVLAVGAPGITYKWQRSDTAEGGYSDIAEGNGYTGTTTSQLTVDTKAGFGAGFYRAVASAPNAEDRFSSEAHLNLLGITPTAPIVSDQASCSTSSDFTIVASGSASGNYTWWDVATGGIALDVIGDTFQTPVLTTNTYYFVSTIDGVCPSPRAPILLTLNAGDTPPTVTGASRCDPGTLVLSANGAANGQYNWFEDAVSGPITAQNNSTFTTPSLSTTRSYFVSIVLADCESPRAEVIATIAAPQVPVVSDKSACLNTSVDITATVSTGEIRWYNVATGGQSFFTGATYTTPLLTTTTTYYITNFVSDCESARVPVIVTVGDCTNNQPPVIAATSSSTIVGGTVTIDLGPLLSDPDNNLDMSTLKILVQPTSGALASIVDGQLIIDYTGSTFAGDDELTIEICDAAGVCVQQVIRIAVASDIVIYNAVSPNGDGKNEVFFIAYIDLFEGTRSNTVTIYNRWGDLVFEVADYDNTTNVFAGKNKSGNDLPSGTYFYRIEFRDGRKSETGYLSLKR